MTSVLIVGGARAHRDALADALDRGGRVGTVETVPHVDAALARVREARFDVVLLDVADAAAAPGTRTLLAATPETRIVALGIIGSETEIVALAEAGVSGYVPRQASLQYLLEEIESVADGQLLASPELAAVLLRRVRALANGGPDAQAELSARQIEILGLLEEGFSNKQIARRLSIELQTVKNHVHNILEKLGVQNRTEAGAWARRHGLAPVEIERPLYS